MFKLYEYAMVKVFFVIILVLLVTGGYGLIYMLDSFDSVSNPNGNSIFNLAEGTDLYIGLGLFLTSAFLLVRGFFFLKHKSEELKESQRVDQDS